MKTITLTHDELSLLVCAMASARVEWLNYIEKETNEFLIDVNRTIYQQYCDLDVKLRQHKLTEQEEFQNDVHLRAI